MNTAITPLLKFKTVSEWFETTIERPVPRSLCGEFWHEGELAILFADTGMGKSVLAVQIADALSSGDDSHDSVLGIEGGGRKVLYLDFELTDKQFELRYCGENDEGELEHFEMSDNFYRGVIDPCAEIPDGMTFTGYLMKEIERCLDETQAEVLIVDNISFLRGSQGGTREAAELMRDLRRLIERRSLSILALAHTPKRQTRRPVTLNDLQGSKALSNFADSIFAIGESCLGPDIRYIKQLKARSREIVYDGGYVPGYSVNKQGSWLMLEHVAFGTELSHLKDFAAALHVRYERWYEVDRLNREGLSQRGIARKLDISAASVNRYLNTHISYPDSSGRTNYTDLYKCYGYGFRREVTERLDSEDALEKTSEIAEAAAQPEAPGAPELSAPLHTEPAAEDKVSEQGPVALAPEDSPEELCHQVLFDVGSIE